MCRDRNVCLLNWTRRIRLKVCLGVRDSTLKGTILTVFYSGFFNINRNHGEEQNSHQVKSSAHCGSVVTISSYENYGDLRLQLRVEDQ